MIRYLIPDATPRVIRVLAAALALAGCGNVTLKTLELPPVDFATGISGPYGSVGYCISRDDVPQSAYSAGVNQVLVGTDDYFSPGTDPFPCDDLRATNFRAGVRFDLSGFDSITSATLSFDTSGSVSRMNGESVGTLPPISVATMLGVATEPPYSNKMLADNDVPLPSGGNLSLGVTSQVRDWVAKTRPNFGFVIWGPRGPIDNNHPPKDNDASLSWYQNFRLEIVYNPAQNPRAPN